MCCSLFHSCLGSPWVTVAHDLLHFVCRCIEGRGNLLSTGFVLAFLLARYRHFLCTVFVPVHTVSILTDYKFPKGVKVAFKGFFSLCVSVKQPVIEGIRTPYVKREWFWIISGSLRKTCMPNMWFCDLFKMMMKFKEIFWNYIFFVSFMFVFFYAL